MFHVGDKVAHPGHGGCVIDAIGERSWNGQSDFFYTLHPLTEQNTTIMVPVERAQTVGLREVITSCEAEEILESMHEIPADWISDNQVRRQEYTAAIKGTDLKAIASVLATLICRESEVKLSNADKDLLQKAKKKLYSEIALSLNQSIESIEQSVRSIQL